MLLRDMRRGREDDGRLKVSLLCREPESDLRIEVARSCAKSCSPCLALTGLFSGGPTTEDLFLISKPLPGDEGRREREPAGLVGLEAWRTTRGCFASRGACALEPASESGDLCSAMSETRWNKAIHERW